MNRDYTPGPWSEVGLPKNSPRYSGIVAGNGTEVARNVVNPADARLIAAAPKMYDELEIGVGYADDVVANWSTGDLARAVNTLRLWADSARVVLARATP